MNFFRQILKSDLCYQQLDHLKPLTINGKNWPIAELGSFNASTIVRSFLVLQNS